MSFEWMTNKGLHVGHSVLVHHKDVKGAITMKLYFRLGLLALSAALAGSSMAIVVNTSSNANDLLNAGLGNLPSGVSVTGVTYNGASNASGTYKNLNFSPLSSIGRGLLMTTGDAQTAVGPNDQDSAGMDNGAAGASFANYDGVNSIDLFNVATMTVTFETTQKMNLGFDFAFGSEEYYYYTNSPYNDSFFAFLDGGTTTLALDKNGQAITIDNQFLTIDNRPDTFDPSNGFGLPDKPGTGTADGISELQYDGFTPTLRTSFDVAAGSHTLTFVIGDAGDPVLDSGVFISHILGPGNGGEDTDPVPEPSSMIALAGAAPMILAMRRRRTVR